MNKRAAFPIAIILGLIVIGLVGYGIVNVGYNYAKEKFFGERGILPGFGEGEEEFVPYTGPELTKEETTIVNSVSALTCALNSVALGEYRPEDEGVCPLPLVKKSDSIAKATGQSWLKVTGQATAPKEYEGATVECSGAEVNRIKVPAVEAPAIRTIIEELINCKRKVIDKEIDSETRCAYLDLRDWPSFSEGPQIEFDKERLKRYALENREEFKGFEEDLDYFFSDAWWGKLMRLKIETNNKKITREVVYDFTLCIDYREIGLGQDYVSINGCDTEAGEQFTCTVTNFELPQQVAEGVGSLFVQAYGDPRWLVYYESLPYGPAEYWQKEWTDIFNLWNIGVITASGLLNVMLGPGGKAATVSRAAAREGKELAKEGAEALLKKGITEAEKELIQRLGKAGVENTLKTLVIEESVQSIYGVGPKIASEISQEIVKAVGKRTGQRAWKRALRKGLDKKISDILEKRLTQVPDAFVNSWRQTVPITELVGPGQLPLAASVIREKARRAYLETVKKIIIEGGEIPESILKKELAQIAGSGLQDGVRGIVQRQLTKELTRNMLTKRAYESLLESLITKGGKINTELLKNHGEAALKQLDNIAKINPTAASGAWGGAREITDSILAGSLGGFTTRNFPRLWTPSGLYKFIAAQSPIKMSTRGFIIGGTAVKTAVNLPRWVATHSYPTVLLLSWLIAAQDAANEKYLPVGGNALGINQPTLLGRTNPAGLHEAANDYFITNHIKELGRSEVGQRMYFVSPCKANLKVYKRKCTCYKNPQLNKYTYPSGTINVKPGSIKQLDNDVLESRFEERWKLPIVQQQWAERWRSEWDAADAETKKLYKNYEEYSLDQFVEMRFAEYDKQFYNDIVSPSGGIVVGREGLIHWLAGTSTPQGGLSARSEGERMKEWYDSSNVIKRCDQSSMVKDMANFGGLLWNGMLIDAQGYGVDPEAEEALQNILLSDEYFKVDCLEIEPERLDGTYCYDHFPQTAWIRTAVMVTSMVVDAVIIGATAGLATPLALLATGVTAAAIDVGLEAFEKWP